MRCRNFRWLALWFAVTAMPLMTSQHSDGTEIHIVAPAGLKDVEGSGVRRPVGSPFRGQSLYLASDFGMIPEGGAFIIGHAARADGRQQSEGTLAHTDSIITLSTTSMDSLSENFSDNTGSDATVVFDGNTSISYPVSGSGLGPNPFGANVGYQTPFFYDPSLGNLLLDHISHSGTMGSVRRDSQAIAYDSVLGGLLGNSQTLLSREVTVRQFTIVPDRVTDGRDLLDVQINDPTEISTWESTYGLREGGSGQIFQLPSASGSLSIVPEPTTAPLLLLLVAHSLLFARRRGSVARFSES